MGDAARYRPPRGFTEAAQGSPLSQKGVPGSSQPTRITHGFTQFLPSRSRTFFQRQFVVDFLEPVQPGSVNPYPREQDIAKIIAPPNQAIVIQRVEFFALQHNGIDVDGLAEVSKGESTGTLAFKFAVQNRSALDFHTNLPGRGPFVTYGGPIVQGGVGVQPRMNQGQAVQGTGSAVPDQQANSYFATYVQPGQPIKASYILLRPPPFDLRAVGVKYGGWLANSKELQSILDMLQR